MATLCTYIGTLFLGTAFCALVFLSLLASRDEEIRALEMVLIVVIAAVPASIAAFFYLAARQLAV